MFRLIFLNRAKGAFWSIEELFAAISRSLPTSVRHRTVCVPRTGAKLRSVLANLLAVLRQKDVDCMHVTGDIHYAVLGVWRCPVVLTIHDLRFLDEAKGVRRFLLRLLWVYLPVRFADRVTVISEFTKNRLLEYCGVAADKLVVIPNCVDSGFVPSTRAWPNSNQRVLHIGTTENKNLERTIEACRGYSIELWVLGILNNRQRGLIEAAGITFKEFTGLTRTEVVLLYNECDVVSFVSTYEGFGLPVLEAQAVGRPLLTSNISPMREVSGGGAILVDPLDVGDIRNGLGKILGDSSLRDALVEKGFRNVQKYSADAIAAKYLQVYESVLGRDKCSSISKS